MRKLLLILTLIALQATPLYAVEKNVSGQKLTVFAYDSTTNAPKTGDAANITAYVSKDDGTVTVLGDTSATQLDATNAPGYYVFDLTQAETNAIKLGFSAKSSTSNVVVLGAPPVAYTTPPNATLTSIDSNGRLDLIKIAGTTQTARDIGASVLISVGTGTGQINLSSGAVPLTGDLTATMKTSVNAEVLDVISTDTFGEPTGTPGATVSLREKIGWLYMALRNPVTVTATKKQFLDDGGSGEWSKPLSDDGTTYTEGEAAAP